MSFIPVVCAFSSPFSPVLLISSLSPRCPLQLLSLSNVCFSLPSPLLCPVLLLLIPSKGCSSVQGHRLPLSSSVDPSPLYDWGQRLSPWWLTSRWEALLSGHGVVYNANMHNRVIYNVRGMRRRPFTATLIFRSGYEPRQTQ